MANTWGGGTPTLEDVLISGASANGQVPTDLGAPSLPDDAATKDYVDTAIPAAQDLEATLTTGDFTNGRTIYGAAASGGGKLDLATNGGVTVTAVGASRNISLVSANQITADAEGGAVNLTMEATASYFGYHGDTEISMSPTGSIVISSGANGVSVDNTGVVSINADDDIQLGLGGKLQVKGASIFTKAAAAPGVSFISLIYRDTTAVSGRTYCWNFDTGAYDPISGAF